MNYVIFYWKISNDYCIIFVKHFYITIIRFCFTILICHLLVYINILYYNFMQCESVHKLTYWTTCNVKKKKKIQQYNMNFKRKYWSKFKISVSLLNYSEIFIIHIITTQSERVHSRLILLVLTQSRIRYIIISNPLQYILQKLYKFKIPIIIYSSMMWVLLRPYSSKKKKFKRIFGLLKFYTVTHK